MDNGKRKTRQGRRSKNFYILVIILVAAAVAAGYMVRRYVDKGAGPARSVSSGEAGQGKEKADVKGEKGIERPLTAVARPAPKVDVSVKEHPRERIQEMKLSDGPQKAVKRTLPEDVMDLKGPPQWTEPIAMPAIPEEAPDPFTAPPIKVNPARLPQQDVPRLSPGVRAAPEGPKK